MSSESGAAAVKPSWKQRAGRVLPARLVERLDRWVFGLRRARIRAVHRLFNALGLAIVRRADYYSTLPVLADLERNRARWDAPSELPGVAVDLDRMRDRLSDLDRRFAADFAERAGDYLHNTRRGFGPGYPEFDARTLYYMLRDLKPGAYLEVGSGLSTYYASLAAAHNAGDGSPTRLRCIEPYPFAALRELPGIELIESFVQDVPLERFTALQAGDVLFIDSSHALKIDSDVAYLIGEVLPRIAPGVVVHIHDMPFPYLTPFPADTWLFGERWPVYWNEAMAVHAFLAFNTAFEVELSVPLLRHDDEAFLREKIRGYGPLASDPNPPSSLWLRRVG